MSNNKTNLILNFIRYNPSCSLEIISSKVTEVSKPTIEKILLQLLSDNLISVNDNLYSLDSSLKEIKSKDYNSDIYFDVYIKKEHRQMIYFLFDFISKAWLDINGSLPTRTQMYKLISKINLKLNLSLPMVWYKFGEIPVVVYNSEVDYSNYNSKELNNLDLKTNLNKLTNIIFEDHTLTSTQMRDKMYYSNNDDIHFVYQKKLEFEKNILEGNFKDVEKNVDEFITKIPYFKDEDKIVNKFRDTVYFNSDLKLKDQKNSKFKDLYLKIFSTFWNIIAIQNFRYYIWKYYSKNNVDIHNISNCNFDLNKYKEEFNQLEEDFYVLFYENKVKR